MQNINLGKVHLGRNGLAALDAQVRAKLEAQKAVIISLTDQRDIAERQVRDLARENEKLRREIAELRSRGAP